MTAAERSDLELLRAHAAGDPGAFEEIVRRHRDRLWAVALRTMREPEEAADALQDALISAYRAAGSFRGDSAVTTWLHRIVVNACLDRIRRRQVRSTVPLPEEGPGEPSSSTSTAAVAPLRTVKPVSDALFDPSGNKTEIKNIDASTDGDPDTSWRTDRYSSGRSSTFAGLKPGIGIAYDFGKATALRQITVATGSPGVQIQIRAGDTPIASTDADGYPVVSTTQTVTAPGTFSIKAGTSARYYVVWLTQLTGDGDGYRGSVSEVTFKG